MGSMSETNTHAPSVPTAAPQPGMALERGVTAMFWTAAAVFVSYAAYYVAMHIR